MCQTGLAVARLALIKRSSASPTLQHFLPVQKHLDKRFWNQKTPVGFFLFFRAFQMMTKGYCVYQDLTLVIQTPESPVEDKLHRWFWLKDSKSVCAGSDWGPSLSVFWDMVSDNRCPGKGRRTGWRFWDVSSIYFPILQQGTVKEAAVCS